jgi:exopolysaccharide production protein ExoY
LRSDCRAIGYQYAQDAHFVSIIASTSGLKGLIQRVEIQKASLLPGTLGCCTACLARISRKNFAVPSALDRDENGSYRMRVQPLSGNDERFDRHQQQVTQTAGAGSSRAADLPKVVFDRTAAALGLLLLTPLFLMIAALIYFRDPGPVFYAHRRIGKGGRSFDCLKFRTMATDGDALLEKHLAQNPQAASEWRETRKLKSDPRVSPLGNALRKASLDELPQLINILRGEMSVVGPRPIVDAEVHHYGDALEDYLSVDPGLTGLWQISGRNDVGYRERVELDRSYARTRSFAGDLVIICKTVPAVLQRRGSY